MLDRRRAIARRLILTSLSASLCLALAAVMTPSHASVVATDSLPYFGDGDSSTAIKAPAAQASQEVVLTNGGAVDSAASFSGGGTAADFPAFGGGSMAPRGVVAMTNTSATDVLTPLAKAFSFGADINSDAVSTGTAYDNGNNIVQRGLFGDAAQFKIQVDHGSAMCRIKGAGGNISVTSTKVMPTGQWFRVTCTRKVLATGDKVVLAVTPIDKDGTMGSAVLTKSGIKKVGKLNFAQATPVSIGGKLISASVIHTESDQFNGLIDNPFLDIG